MPFINPWGTSTPQTTTNTKKQAAHQPTESEKKYQYVDEILNAPDYYHVLGINKDSPNEDIRRAYIRVNKII